MLSLTDELPAEIILEILVHIKTHRFKGGWGTNSLWGFSRVSRLFHHLCRTPLLIDEARLLSHNTFEVMYKEKTEFLYRFTKYSNNQVDRLNLIIDLPEILKGFKLRASEDLKLASFLKLNYDIDIKDCV